MKNAVLTTCLILFSGVIIASHTVTSTLQGSRLSFIAEEGSFVKKGEPLVKYSTSSTMDKIARAQAGLQGAEADLKNKTGDKQRYSTLKESNSASAEKLEDVEIEYDYAVSSVAKYNSTIKSLEAKLDMAIIPAPFDCKVIKVQLSENSGTDYGQKIMDIEDVSNSKTVENTTENSFRTVSSTMYGGVVDYIAVEGKIVKKGELLAKLVNPVTEAQLDGLKAEVIYAQCLVEAAKKYSDRYSKLKGKSVSRDYAENVELAYQKAKYNLARAKKTLEFYNLYNADGAIAAPFDCKVSKVIMILKGGSEAGSPIMEITPLKIPTSSNLAFKKSSLSVTSILAEIPIIYLPEEGQIVKNGESLVKLNPTSIDNEIERAKLDLEYAQLNLNDKEKDYKRSSYLRANNSTSQENFENSELAYEVAKTNLEEYKMMLSYIENKKAKTIIAAPYDCKVTKVMLIVGGGTMFGTPILEIEKL